MAVWGRFAALGARATSVRVAGGLCVRGGLECCRAGRGDAGGTRPAPGREGSFVSAPGVGGGEATCVSGTRGLACGAAREAGRQGR